jgi:acetyl-CoA carboxylase biotin carboxyl carrier protein
METDDKITYAEILQVLEAIKAVSQFSEIHLKFGDIEIDLSRGLPPSIQASNSEAPLVAAIASPQIDNLEPKTAPVEPTRNTNHSVRTDRTWSSNSVLVRSPMVGTFYRRPSPDAAPFVEIGQSVEEVSVLCIVEVMKLMNSISAGARGTVTHILVADEELVEPDQILMVIEPR